MSIQRITNCLWFDSNAEEAATFYTSIFPNSRIGSKQHYTKVGKEHHGKEPGTVVTVEFKLDGQNFTALNGGPIFKFTPAISLQVGCEGQAEVDHFYSRLGEGGDTTLPCGWLTDKFGVSWQIIPKEFAQMQREANPKQNERVMEEMFKMKKLEIEPLKKAFDEAA